MEAPIGVVSRLENGEQSVTAGDEFKSLSLRVI